MMLIIIQVVEPAADIYRRNTWNFQQYTAACWRSTIQCIRKCYTFSFFHPLTVTEGHCRIRIPDFDFNGLFRLLTATAGSDMYRCFSCFTSGLYLKVNELVTRLTESNGLFIGVDHLYTSTWSLDGYRYILHFLLHGKDIYRDSNLFLCAQHTGQCWQQHQWCPHERSLFRFSISSVLPRYHHRTYRTYVHR